MEIPAESQGSPSGNQVVEMDPSRAGNVYKAQAALYKEGLCKKPIPVVRGLGNRTHTTQKYNILPQSTTSDFARRA